MKKVEILSPAGSIESLQAGIAADCDAIYIGGSKFGARAMLITLTKTCYSGHRLYSFTDKKLYLTINTLLKNNELKKNYMIIYINIIFMELMP